MSKLSMLKKATGLGGKEEEKKEEPISQDTSAVDQKPSADAKESSPPNKEEKDSAEKKSETPNTDPKTDEKSNTKEPTKEEPKNDSAENLAPSTPPQSDSKDDPEKKEGEKSDEKKRGRKKGIRRDRVIVMLDKETIEILDSFSISRSGAARAIILGSHNFLSNLEGEFKEDALIQKIKEKLG